MHMDVLSTGFVLLSKEWARGDDARNMWDLIAKERYQAWPRVYAILVTFRNISG